MYVEGECPVCGDDVLRDREGRHTCVGCGKRPNACTCDGDSDG